MAYYASFAILTSCKIIASNYQYILGVLSCRTTLSTSILPVDNCGMLQLNVTCTASLPAGFFSYVLAAGGEYGW